MPPPTAVATVATPPSGVPALDVDRLSVDTMRGLAIDMVERARSGHPGLPLGMAPVAFVLFADILRHNPADPAWPDRDRFVLSAGHGSALLYAALHLSGYSLSREDLAGFRSWGSCTPGHPERGLTPGVETTTGPLGQGFANAVGMALAEAWQRDRYGSAVVDHRTFVLASDGDLMEGVSAEAASLAGQLGLGRLICIWDDNGITIDGPTSLSFGQEDVEGRFAAYGWHVVCVENAEDLDAVRRALRLACAEEERPSLVVVRSVIGAGSPNKAGTAGVHGSPLGPDEAAATKRALGLDPDAEFAVPPAVYDRCSALASGQGLQAAWSARVARWRAANALVADEWDAAQAARPAASLGRALPSFEWGALVSTRAASGKTLAALADHLPATLGGAADLAGSVKVGFGDPWTPGSPGRDIQWGVREHAMAAAVNGLALHGGVVRPYGATFLQFADYMRPAIRLSALMGLDVAWVFSHDSLGVGEDGPTHQPVEHLAALRAIPGLTVIRPSDAAEAAEAWRYVLEEHRGPVAFVLSRQDLPVLAREAAPAVARGAYVLRDADEPSVVLVGTGSEVSVALEAADLLAGDGVAARVVAMPSWELFAAQADEYRDAVLPADLPAVGVEAGVAQGWQRWVHTCVTVESFGASAPGPQVLARYGITASAVAEAALDLVSRL